MNKIFVIISMLVTFCPINGQNVFFVSPSGNDSSNGSLQSPFASIGKAIAEARTTEGETTVYMREGDYRISSPVVFTPEDASDNRKLVIKSYGNEKVVIKGSIALENLQWTGHKNGIMKTKITGNPVMDMLVVNGEIRHQARFPNYDSTAVRFNGTSADATSRRRVKSWKNPEGGYLHAMHLHDWGDFHYRITGKNRDGSLSMEGGWQNNRPMGMHSANRMVENIFEELDAEGEWYYNAGEQTLYYYPPEGEDIQSALFESPQIKSLVEIRGSISSPVRNISIEGLDLTQTVRTFMEKYEPLLRSDWTVYRGGAVVMEGAEKCAIKNCNLYNLGGNAVFFNYYNRDCEVSGSHFYNIGASAILFVGDTSAVRSPSFEYGQFVPAEEMDFGYGHKNDNYPADCRIYDNLIHHIGLFEKQTTGVELSMSRRITVSHNSIYYTPRAGINISEGTWGGHILEFNDVFNTVRETGDHGSFNSWGRDRYWLPDGRTVDSLVAGKGYDILILADAMETTVIRNNRFRCDRGWDIDLDDGSSNYHIYNNLCLNGGLKLREGFYRTVENNILLNSTFHRHVWYRNNGNIFTSNIVMHPYPDPIGYEMRGALIDCNIFSDSLSLLTAQKHDTDRHSIVTDIRFVNPSAGDFRVDNDCTEVFRAGFRNFSMDRFGVESPQLKAIAETPEFPVPVTISDHSGTETVNWGTIKIKNLETIGERSATGMDSERGVYIVSSDGTDTFGGYFKSNDVITGFAGKQVNNLNDLQNAINSTDTSKPQNIIIFRNQKEITITIKGSTVKSGFNKQQ
jgi:hypothetical protein